MIGKMRNKISDLETTIYNYNSYSNDILNSDKKSNNDYQEKKNSENLINHLEQENRNLKEEIKKRERIIINLENQMSDMKAVNKTCHELLTQINI
jgi:predicted RNase H-like nuclease (RuvC/YqgF family)